MTDSLSVAVEHLTNVVNAYDAWRGTVNREKAARMVFRAAVSDARDAGAKLHEIADQLGVTRQAIQKVLRELRQEQAEREAAGIWLEREAEKDYRRDKVGIGRVNCASCGHFKSLPSSVCTHCGDEPGTFNGSTFETDEAHYGHRVLR